MANYMIKYYKIYDSSILLQVYIKTGVKQSAIIGVADNRLVIGVAAKPVKGAANKELIRFISSALKTPKSQIVIAKGEQARYKQILLPSSDKLVALLDGFEK